jgi:hypothetical protein
MGERLIGKPAYQALRGVSLEAVNLPFYLIGNPVGKANSTKSAGSGDLNALKSGGYNEYLNSA